MTKAIVYKFGGASVKDAAAIKNLSNILFNRLRSPMVIVVSAIGKTTNALEEILRLKYDGVDFYSNITILRKNHLAICQELFEEGDLVFGMVENIFLQLARVLEVPLTKENYDEYYDRVVGFGELLSTKIIHAYLCHRQQYCIWQDARDFILTDDNFRFAKVDWEQTARQCQQKLVPVLKQLPVVTQGFVGSTKDGQPTTLGREGSDFSAAIFAKSLGAESVTIWKDVPGVLNADPKRFEETVKFDRLDYKEAAEMTFYGASVIHPRTIKPLANAKIPLFVRSFLQPEEQGTVIGDFGEGSINVPTIVVKDRQVLVTFEVTDFTFINESHMHQVYAELDRLKLRANLIQSSAITISICTDRELFKLEQLLEEMKGIFKVKYNEGLQLVTVKNYDERTKKRFLDHREILLEQTTRSTFQVVCRQA
ncbi:aspartate kinase [Echinicola vietnamensis]|uniref:Aspartokinase n=1 Tax=Echinicola vietnamensis (strain DSM 17526 / LMG 23754 / KMM 6221) TaxID=926556 RepID=L0FZC0_ECHVK|nr:aspartate kinase [Echinicola vietnamensis]AGA78086.1 aspartate kinase [Echinicola vietnamensis DSM 17526]